MDHNEELLALASEIAEEEDIPYPFVLDVAALALGRVQLYARQWDYAAYRERLHLAVFAALWDRDAARGQPGCPVCGLKRR